jgi:hypothetical protein
MPLLGPACLGDESLKGPGTVGVSEAIASVLQGCCCAEIAPLIVKSVVVDVIVAKPSGVALTKRCITTSFRGPVFRDVFAPALFPLRSRQRYLLTIS